MLPPDRLDVLVGLAAAAEHLRPRLTLRLLPLMAALTRVQHTRDVLQRRVLEVLLLAS